MRSAVFISLLLIASPALSASPCASEIGNCGYYRCREEAHPCGDEGYFLRFSYRYCSEFETPEFHSKVTPQTGEWLDRVARCLQEDVETIPVETSCSDTQKLAVAGHAHCYVSTGFCSVPLEDQLTIIHAVYREAVHPDIDHAFARIIEACASQSR